MPSGTSRSLRARELEKKLVLTGGREAGLRDRVDLFKHTIAVAGYMYKEYVICLDLKNCYYHAVDYQEYSIPETCCSTDFAMHTAKFGAVIHCHASRKGAYCALSQR
jgi:hypothetical protein